MFQLHNLPSALPFCYRSSILYNDLYKLKMQVSGKGFSGFSARQNKRAKPNSAPPPNSNNASHSGAPPNNQMFINEKYQVTPENLPTDWCPLNPVRCL